jgi:hypothetical protein
MSFHTLLGAVPIDPSLESLDPKPNARVGELRASSRGGAMFRSISELLSALPDHEILRFIGHEAVSLTQRQTDPQTRWTLLDPGSASRVITALDSLLAACDQHADALASRVSFGAEQLNTAEFRQALRSAAESTDLLADDLSGDDGDSADDVFAVLAGLREFLRRACAENQSVAVFTWAPA